MKKRLIVITILILVAGSFFPVVTDWWHKRQMEKKTVYLREIYRAVLNVNMDRELRGRPNIQSLDEVLDDQTKERMRRDGIDWQDIRYFPQSCDALNSNILFSVDYSGYVIEVRKGGAVFYNRKKHVEPSAIPSQSSASGAGGR